MADFHPVRCLLAYSGGTVPDSDRIHYSPPVPMANQAALEQHMKLCVLYARKTGLSRIQFAKWTACSGNIRIQFVFLN